MKDMKQPHLIVAYTFHFCLGSLLVYVFQEKLT
jgi:hypothetical protein